MARLRSNITKAYVHSFFRAAFRGSLCRGKKFQRQKKFARARKKFPARNGKTARGDSLTRRGRQDLAAKEWAAGRKTEGRVAISTRDSHRLLSPTGRE
jgi:hypothetical protein